MPCHTRMKTLHSQGILLSLYFLGLTLMVTSLEPGFLDFDNLPDTNFTCVGKVIGGYYADLETSCQMFHVCTIGQMDEPMDIRFLCLNGTVFDQETRVCERIDEVDCSKSEQFYSLNLELYGNTQPPILEDSPDTEPPDIYKQSSTTTTTTTPRPTKPKTTRPNFIITTTNRPPVTTLTEKILNFQGSNSADIRFNPEEINISLNPGAPPSIRPKPISFQQQSFSDTNKRVIVTTHTTVYKTEADTQKISTTQKPKELEDSQEDTENYYNTETESYQFHPNFRPSHDLQGFSSPKNDYKSSTFRSLYQTTTDDSLKLSYNQRGPTTYRNHPFNSPVKPSPSYYHQTDKPPRIQLPLPLPLIPTISPLTFSSPAPFSLNRHVETKRFTDHHQPPRIVISASASVSDASGRKFNYSLGTIGDSKFFGQPPPSYDEYKEDDVGLDPFYHDVPKLGRRKRHYLRVRRNKRSLESKEKHKVKLPEINGEQDAIEVIRFLYNWYNEHNKTSKALISFPINPDTITEINDELTPRTDDYLYENSEYNYEVAKNSIPQTLQELKPPELKNDSVKENNEGTTVSEDYDLTSSGESTKNYEILDVKSRKIKQPPRLSITRNFTITSMIITKRRREIMSIMIKRFTIKLMTLIIRFWMGKCRSSMITWTIITRVTILQQCITTNKPNLTTESPQNVTDYEEYYDEEETTTAEPVTQTEEIDVGTTMFPSTVDVPKDESTESVESTTTIVDNTLDKEDVETTTYPDLQKFILDVETTTNSISEINPTTTPVTETITTTVFTPEEETTTPVITTTEEPTTLNPYTYLTTTTEVIPETSTESLTTTKRRQLYQRNHRFGTYGNKKRKPSITEEIVDVIKNKMDNVEDSKVDLGRKKIEFNINAYTANLAYRNKNGEEDEASVTDASFARSANPTVSKQSKDYLVTTPLTKSGKDFKFNCFNKPIDRFYSDPRDCRLFHYCTQGYTKTQLLDMKFVCDLGTFFDQEKLICTKTKPSRCT
ncbi:PREDICTED: uncharacterized protein LOC108567978 [Nicrophorus vespilloides]|uniref:Uncharacterized protein LOC108567978 n=1 Tax=Nicrophorus vespilloides TaxID=110193 RepID=A0ABM1NBU6_NICVS|nr:PREDICTED: uncharacterized protein LOC108567978 [Nicrophorus vespilloides]